MNKVLVSFTFALLTVCSLYGFTSRAAELEIIDCKTDLNHGTFRQELKLTIDDSGKLIGWSGLLNGPLQKSTDVKVYPVEPVNSDFPKILAAVNKNRDTGISPTDVTNIQRVFITGDSDFHMDLYKAYGAGGKFLGWLAGTMGLSGCYAN